MSVLGHIHPIAGPVYLTCFSLSKLISREGAQPSSLDGTWSCGMGSRQGCGRIAASTSHNAVRNIGSFGHPFSLYSVGVLLQKKKTTHSWFLFLCLKPEHGCPVNVWQKISLWTLKVMVRLVPSELGWPYNLYYFYNRVTTVIQLDSSVYSAQISALWVFHSELKNVLRGVLTPKPLFLDSYRAAVQIYNAPNLAATNAEALKPFPMFVHGTGPCF